MINYQTSLALRMEILPRDHVGSQLRELIKEHTSPEYKSNP